MSYDDEWPPRIHPFEGKIIGGEPRYWPNDPTTVTVIVQVRTGLQDSGTLMIGPAQAVTAGGERRPIIIQDIPMMEPGSGSQEFWRHAEVLCLENVTIEEAATFVAIVQTHENDGQLIYPRPRSQSQTSE